MHPFIRTSSIIVMTAGLFACNEKTDTNQPLETLQQKASYSFGVDVAMGLKKQGIQLDINALNRGIADAYTDTELALSDEDRTQAKTAFQIQIREAMMKEQAAAGDINLAEGKAFLEANASKPGVITTESGLQYKIITSGDGKQPTASDTVSTHYKGTLIDGREFDSTFARGTPVEFTFESVMNGWAEVLPLMKVGATYQIFVPPELGFGQAGYVDQQRNQMVVEPNEALMFDLKLVEIVQ